MKLKSLIIFATVFAAVQFNLPVFAQHKNVGKLSECTKKNVRGELPQNVNIPRQLCADEKKPADARETVKPGNGLENKPNHTINNTDAVYGGMSADLNFNRLPAEVRQIIKLTFPEIAADQRQLYSLLIIAENFPETGKFSKFVRNYKYDLQVSNGVDKKDSILPKLPTFIFVRQKGKLKLRFLEILSWDANEKTYK